MSKNGTFYIGIENKTDIEEIISGKKTIYLNYGKFGVDESRVLQQEILAINSSLDIAIVISVSSFTYEAQNSLLKILEELPNHVSLIFLVPSFTNILPTVLSRAEILLNIKDSNIKDEIKFIQSNYTKRLVQISKLCDTKKYDDHSSMKHAVLLFVFSVKNNYHKQMTPELANLFINTISYLQKDGVSIKIIMEHFALSLPCDIL